MKKSEKRAQRVYNLAQFFVAYSRDRLEEGMVERACRRRADSAPIFPLASKYRIKQLGTVLWYLRMATIWASFLSLLSCQILNDFSSCSPMKQGKFLRKRSMATVGYSYLSVRKRKSGPSNCSLLIARASENVLSVLRSTLLQSVINWQILLISFYISTKGYVWKGRVSSLQCSNFLAAKNDSNLYYLTGMSLGFEEGDLKCSKTLCKGSIMGTSAYNLLLILFTVLRQRKRSSRARYSSIPLQTSR